MKEKIDSIQDALIEFLQSLIPGLELDDTTFILVAILLSTVIALVIYFIFRALIKWIEIKAKHFQSKKIHDLKIHNQEILTGDQIEGAIGKLFNWVQILIFLLILYLYLNTVFSFFPQTHGVSMKLFSHFLNAVYSVVGAAWNYLPNLITLVVIGVFGIYGIKLARIFFKGVEEERIAISGFYSEWAAPTFTIVRFLIVVLFVIIAYPYLPGNKSPAFQAVSIFLGILVSLGSTGAISNIIAGISLTYMRAFKIGDSVQIADAVGTVVEKTMFVTRIKTVKNVEIAIPNAMVMNNHIFNYSARAEDEGLILHTKVTIGYDVEWKEVHKLLIDAAARTSTVENEPSPFVLQTALNDFYVEYELNAYTKKPKQMSVTYDELHRNIQDGFHKAGVEIASPSLMAYRDGNQANIPGDYLPKDFNPVPTGLWPFQGPTKKS